MMNDKKTIYITLISGKGGAGKTVLALGIAKILFEAGFKVLLIDSDFATHGASYFLEGELDPNKQILSFADIIVGEKSDKNILKTTYGFSFIPSTLNPSETKNIDFNENISDKHFNQYDYVLFDCQAGYSKLSELVLEYSDKNIVVLEADAVSSSALRVLYLQLSKFLHHKNTWQIFNKLTEEERGIYGNISDGTFFINLPPIPFDWKVRSAFAFGKIPSLFEKESVFGLAILRFLKIIIKDELDVFQKIETKAVGNWHNDLMSKITNLEDKKKEIEEGNKQKKREIFRNRMNFISGAIGLFSVLFSILIFIGVNLYYYLWISIGIFGIMISLSISIITKNKIRFEVEADKKAKDLEEIEAELTQYKTLVKTDKRLSEYLNQL